MKLREFVHVCTGTGSFRRILAEADAPGQMNMTSDYRRIPALTRT